MFRTISIIGFLVTFFGIGICCMRFPCCRKCQWSPVAILKRFVHILAMLPLEQKLNRIGTFRKLVYLLALLCFLVLVITGFYPTVFLNQPIYGYWLILHATFAPVFAVCLAVLAVMWAGNCTFGKDDWLAMRSRGNELLRKICFWLMVILALPVILSIVLSMFEIFGTPGQDFLLQLHRYSALLLALIIILHTYLTIRSRMGQQ
jgi:cytochrome b subunit of formate dehydrogenase